MDISVEACRTRGERRKRVFSKSCNPDWKDSQPWNPYPILINHRKHEGALYRAATGGEEGRGKPRFNEDYFK